MARGAVVRGAVVDLEHGVGDRRMDDGARRTDVGDRQTEDGGIGQKDRDRRAALGGGGGGGAKTCAGHPSRRGEGECV